MKVVRQFWAVCAITLGVWEATAITTKRVPTITATCRRVRTRRIGKAAIGLWLVGLGWHLLKSEALDVIVEYEREHQN